MTVQHVERVDGAGRQVPVPAKAGAASGTPRAARAPGVHEDSGRHFGLPEAHRLLEEARRRPAALRLPARQKYTDRQKSSERLAAS